MDPTTVGKMVIKVHAEDDVNATLKIEEYSNIQENKNGTYNESQFMGSKKDILIVNGELEYEVPSGTQFILVDSFITDLSKVYELYGSNKTITVDLYVNGFKKQSSISEMYGDQADINWGGLIKSNGDEFSLNRVIFGS